MYAVSKCHCYILHVYVSHRGRRVRGGGGVYGVQSVFSLLYRLQYRVELTHIAVCQYMYDQGTGAWNGVIAGFHAAQDPGNVTQRGDLVGEGRLVCKQTHTGSGHCL